MRRWLTLALVAFAVGCGTPGSTTPDGSGDGPAPDGGVAPAGSSGLRRISDSDIPSDSGGTPHGQELLFDRPDTLIVPDGRLTITYDLKSDAALQHGALSDQPMFARCVWGAYLPPSDLVACTGPDEAAVWLVDAATGKDAGFFGAPMFQPSDAGGYLGIAWLDGAVYLARHDTGVIEVPLAGGRPDWTQERTVYSMGGADVLSAGSDRIYLHDRPNDRLVALRDGMVDLSIPLDCPAVQIKEATDGRIAIACGQEGALVLAHDGTVLSRVQVRGLVMSVDVSDHWLALGTEHGVYLVDLDASPPHRSGYVPAVYGITDVKFHGGLLYVLDWRILSTYQVRAGSVDVPVVPYGYLLPTDEAAIRFPVLDDGDDPLTVEGQVLQPGDIGWIEEQGQPQPWNGGSRTLVQLPSGQQVAVIRNATHLALGEPFPGFSGDETVTLQQPDCGLQFPERLVLGWMMRHGQMSPGGGPWRVVAVPTGSFNPADFAALWGLDPQSVSVASDHFMDPEAVDTVMFLGGRDTGGVYELVGGTVTNFDQVPRGSFFFPPPKP